MRFIDVSHEIEDGMITYKGLPGPVISDHLSREASRKVYAEGTEFSISRIDMVANTGTYLDSPFHRYPEGKDLSQLPLTSLANLEGITIRNSGRSIDASAIADLDVRGKAVLFDTGWSQHWRSDQYSQGHPFLTRAAAMLLVERKAALVGIDSFNIDDITEMTRPVHTVLLGAEIPIVEHLTNLQSLPESGYKFFAIPAKVKRFGTFPVRAFAIA